MLREISSEAAVSIATTVDAVDPDDYFKLGQQVRRLLERVALPRRWTRDDVRDVQKALKDTLREMDRQCAAASVWRSTRFGAAAGTRRAQHVGGSRADTRLVSVPAGSLGSDVGGFVGSS